MRNVVGQAAWSARYYRLQPSGTPGPRLARVTFTATGTMTDPLVQIVRLGAGNAIVDIHRSDRTSWSKAINLSGLEALIVIVGARATPGDFTLQLDDNWQPRQVGIQFGMSGESMLFQLLTIVITPLTAIMTGQLYLKARHAGGETIDTR